MLTKPRDPSKMLQGSVARKKRRFSPLMLAGISVPVVLALIAAGVFVLPRLLTHAAAADPNPNCTLIVPPNPLSAQGLATPYQIFAPDAAQNGPCNEANTAQSAFVQATIYDPVNHTFSVYSPLVIDKGTQPAVAPTPPTLPAGAVVGIWFGFQGTTLTLQSTPRTFSVFQGQCVNGAFGSQFGQFAYCNALNFFRKVNADIANGLVTVPAVGTANDGLPCPTTRDFSVIDQDQSDNVQSKYLVNADGTTAQFSAANQAQLANATVITNASDNGLITNFVDPALGCTPWTAPDLADNNNPVPSLALDELQAAANQPAPVALVPVIDPMTLVNNNPNVFKTDLYRIGADQPPTFSTNGGAAYCQNEFANADPNTGLIRMTNDAQNFELNAPSPAPDAANSLATFMEMRANQSFTNLGCGNLLNMQDPVNLVTDANGVVIGATVNMPGGATATVGQAAPAPAPTAAPTTAPTAPADGGAGTAPAPTAPADGGAGAAPPPAATPTVGDTTGAATPAPAP